MTRGLRRAHRAVFPVVAVAVAAALVSGGLGRAPEPAPSADSTAPEAVLEFESDTLWRSVEITTRIFRGEDRSAFVELESDALPLIPDLLLYWSAEAEPGKLPEGALLLGPYSGGVRRFALPFGAAPRAGMFTLFSLGRRSVLDTAEAPDHGR